MLLLLSISLTAVNSVGAAGEQFVHPQVMVQQLSPLYCIQLLTSSHRVNHGRSDSRTTISLEETTSFSLEPKLSAQQAYKALQENGALITQDQWNLPRDCTGGTCASVSAANILLAAMESYYPGKISEMNSVSKFILHRRLMASFRDEVSRLYRSDFTQGLELQKAAFASRSVMKSVFGRHALPLHFYVENQEPHAFQNIDMSKNSFLLLSLSQKDGRNHAVIGTDIIKNKDADAGFDVVISDPHYPRESMRLNAYESDWRIFFPIYNSSGPIDRASFDRVLTPPVNEFVGITFGKRPESHEWSWARFHLQFGSEQNFSNQKYTITMKSGLKFRKLTIIPMDWAVGRSASIMDAQNLYIAFYNAYILQGSLRFEDIANIELDE